MVHIATTIRAILRGVVARFTIGRMVGIKIPASSTKYGNMDRWLLDIRGTWIAEVKKELVPKREFLCW